MTKPTINLEAPSTLELRNTIARVKQEWLEMNGEQQIRDQINREMEEAKSNILRSFLGFRQDAFRHTWEVDSVNGRDMRNRVFDPIRDQANKKLSEWADTVEFEELFTKTMKQAIRNYTKKELHRQLQQMIPRVLARMAEEIITEVINDPTWQVANRIIDANKESKNAG